jgi:Skp family chaperone for outer membrane proteins
MKRKRLIYALLLPAICFCITYSATAQNSNGISYDENARVDSLADANAKDEVAEDLKRQNSKNLSELKSEKRESKAKAKEAQRVEDDANHAARESKIAYRKEKKAQRVREQADKQSKSAQKARTKSDKN